MLENKRDLSLSMARTNVIVFFISVPVVILQFVMFGMIWGIEGFRATWNVTLLILVIFAGVVVHEFVHALSWMIFGHQPFSAISFGFQWKTLTPYAHLKEPVEVNAYRIGAFMPGLVLGILPYVLSILLGDGNLFWFGLAHTSAAGGDWLILWLIRHVERGRLVEDHPTNAGCYVLEA